MGPEGAINILRRDIKTDEEKTKAVEEYRDTFANPYRAASLGYIDEIIYPKDTRKKIISALDMTHNKRKSNLPRKHGNIPL
jgi:propionyl-CoA carboxylase beta chain